MVKKQLLPLPKTDKKKNRNKKNQLEVIRYQSYDTVKYDNKQKRYIETDNAFLYDIKNVVNSRHNLFSGILKFKKQELTDEQCNQIDFRGRLHYLANLVNQNSNKNSEDMGQLQCLCGCQRSKGKSLSLFVQPQSLDFLGSGVLLMFIFIKSLAICLFMATLVYGIFSFITNIIGGESSYNDQCNNSDYCKFQNNASDGNKATPKINIIVQWWLGLAYCVFWLIAFRFVKYYGRQKNEIIDRKLNSASDKAIKITNLPYGQYSQEQLLQYFQRVWIRLRKQEKQQSQTTQQKKNQQYFNDQSSRNHFKIKQLQVIYNMQFSRKMIENIFTNCLILDTTLKQEEKGNKKTKNVIQLKQIDRYRYLKSDIIRNLELLNDLRKKFLNDHNFRKSLSTSMCLLIFDSKGHQQKMLQKFGKQKIGLITEMQEKIKTCIKLQSESSLSFKGKYLIIQRAPQPSDIIWRNCQKKYSLKRKLIIYGVTTLIILLSFAVITGLSYAQVYLAQQNNSTINKTNENVTIQTVVNILMSIALQIVNKILWMILFYLLQIEYNFTLTEKIISQMNKSLFAIAVNVIVLPIIINYYISYQIFGPKGLSGIVFDYQISLIGIGLIIKLLDPVQIVKRLLIYVRCTRNMILKFLCNSIQLDLQKLDVGIKEVNQFYEGSYLDIAESYVYIIAAIYQAAFFCQLQPFLLVISTIMCILFYWVSKIKLLYICKIPQITDKLVFQTAVTQASLIPVVYGVGSIVVSYLQKSLFVDRPYQVYQSAIAIGIGLIGFFNPKDVLNKFVKAITSCFPCLTAEQIFKQKDNSSEKKQNSSELQINQSVNKNLRIKEQIQNNQQIQIKEDFYKESNALDLLGFENLLCDKVQDKQITNELQKFCASFFPKQPTIQIELEQTLAQNFFMIKGKNLENEMEDVIEQKK